jgi:hypothetical protein
MIPEIVSVLYRGSPGLEIKLDRCIMHYWNHDVSIIFTLYDQYKARGTMPHPGGYLQQPKRLLDAFDLIAAYEAEAAEQK